MQSDSFLIGKKRPEIFTDLKILLSIYCYAGGELPRQPSPLKLRQWEIQGQLVVFLSYYVMVVLERVGKNNVDLGRQR